MEYDKINNYLTDIFNRVLVIEEDALKNSKFSDLTIKEMNTIDVIGSKGTSIASEIAEKLMVTISTVTTAVNNLERKGYVTRERSVRDRRIVHISLTRRGELVYRIHRKFHKAMVNRIVRGISEEDTKILSVGLKNLHEFLEEQRKR
ncbi:MarR family winged helix-turn-helix transcriptional regulator [Lactovum miscens]|uniref:MarR family winged helix-turn-helix transcriptional regulator n=1 Tax=Lactovum miscens TaxID=190387 RepID=UPI00161F689F